MNGIPTYEQVEQVDKVFTDMRVQNWLHTQLFTIRWWVIVTALIIPWIVWWRLVDKKRIFEIFTYGMFACIPMIFIDGFGVELFLWDYPVKLTPYLPRLLPLDFTLLPVSYMLIYQYTKTWKYYLLTHIIAASICSIIIIPIAIKVNMYKLENWNLFYSWVTLFLIALFSKYLIGVFLKKHKCD
jgi:hypothetical protein